MKNIDIINIAEAYKKVDKTLRLPAPVAWKRRLNIRKILDAKNVIDEAINEVNAEYADDDHSILCENGMRQVKPEYMAEFGRKIDEILAQDTPIEVEKIASIDELGDVALSDEELDTLLFMIEEA